MTLRFEYDTYQQVRRNLKSILFVLLAMAGFGFGLIGPDVWRGAFVALLPLDLSKLEAVLKIVTTVLLAPSLLAFVAVEFFRLHDLYDRHVVRWRERLDVDFILPRLYMPFAEHVDRRFLDVAESNRPDCMERLFYPFVRDVEPLIHPNLVRRFWEAATWYWATQLLELVLLATLVVAILLSIFLDLSNLERQRLQLGEASTLLLLLANRYAIRKMRASVRQRTAEELNAIVTEQRGALQQRMRDLANSYVIQNSL
jgi:hypothetical protein